MSSGKEDLSNEGEAMSKKKKYDWSITIDPDNGEDLTIVASNGLTRGENRRLNIITNIFYQHTKDDWDFICEMIAKQGCINSELQRRIEKLENELRSSKQNEMAEGLYDLEQG